MWQPAVGRSRRAELTRRDWMIPLMSRGPQARKQLLEGGQFRWHPRLWPSQRRSIRGGADGDADRRFSSRYDAHRDRHHPYCVAGSGCVLSRRGAWLGQPGLGNATTWGAASVTGSTTAWSSRSVADAVSRAVHCGAEEVVRIGPEADSKPSIPPAHRMSLPSKVCSRRSYDNCQSRFSLP